jgi:hypothetical protein
VELSAQFSVLQNDKIWDLYIKYYIGFINVVVMGWSSSLDGEGKKVYRVLA